MSSASMNSIRSDPIPKYKECAGKNCKSQGVHYLKVAFLNQFGWFCEDCKNGLIGDRLVEEQEPHMVRNEGILPRKIN